MRGVLCGDPMRTIQEFLGRADSKTTQIYAHYAPSAHGVEMVKRGVLIGGAGAERSRGPSRREPSIVTNMAR